MSLSSPGGTYDRIFLSNYLKINLIPQIQRVQGVEEVMVMGGDYAMRIWLKPEVLAQYGLIPQDITTVLGEQNIEAPTGVLGANSSNTFQYSLRYRGRYETPEKFGNLVVCANADGTVLRLRDVADIELGASGYNYENSIDGHPGVTFMVNQTAGSNANEIIKNIDALMEQVKATLPADMVLGDMMSVKDFLDDSTSKVIRTLLEAFVLVMIVVYVFLQSGRATLIPMVSIVVSLVGTFAFMYAIGFSINLLTLFALVLLIGTVADDAIVVVEAVQAKFDIGYKSPYLATIDAMGGITSAIITTTLVFMAVFIPVAFMGGTYGVFYKQFGLTMAAAVGISALNALTLSPAMCALIMTPHTAVEEGKKLSFSSRFHLAFDAAFGAVQRKYKRAVFAFFKRKWIVWGALAVALLGLYILIRTTPTGLIPDEDTGTVFASVTASPGSTLASTNAIMDEVEARIATIPQIQTFAKITGFNFMGGGQSAAAGTFIIKLKPFAQRKGAANSKNAVIAQILSKTADITTARIFAFAPPMISGYGASNGLQIYVQDKQGGSIETLFEHTQSFIDALNRQPAIQRAVTTFSTKYAQYRVDVDAAQCKRAGVSPSSVLGVLSSYLGGTYASNVNRFSKIYRVMLQAPPESRVDPESLNNFFVRTAAGQMAPIGQFITLTKTYGPESLSRFNLFSSILPERGGNTPVKA